MEIVIGIIGIILTVLFFVWPSIKKKFFEHPKLILDLVYRYGVSSNIGLSPHNNFQNGQIIAEEAIIIFELEWTYDLIIRNNSELSAYYPKLRIIDNTNSFNHIDKLEETKPIPPHGEVILKAIYRKKESCRGRERTETGSNTFPGDIKIELEYENSYGIKAYTYFNFNIRVKDNKLSKRKNKLPLTSGIF